ncbi:MAG: DUF4139 domain-containing protein [Crocinitomicaceae bacterium]|nr:DUF4139 domain-containing protein [Crocinitomicaceae bacterium]
MKNLLIALIAITGLSFQAKAEKEKVVKSSIQKVTVYTTGAQVQRKASYAVEKGITTLILEGISPNIDPNSLQVQATGDIIILDSKYHVHYPEPDKINNSNNVLPLKIRRDIRALEDSLFDMGYTIAEVQYKIDVLKAEKRIIENNGTIKGVGKVNDSIPLLKDAIEYYHKKVMEINGQLLKYNREITLLQREQNRMNERLTDLQNYSTNNNFIDPKKNEPIHQLKVTISSESSETGRIKASYLVSNAGWVPMYDLRSSAAENKIALTYKAHVYQNTGVDWDDVRLSLSTNNPYANKTKPTLNPWYLDYYDYRTTGYNNYYDPGKPNTATGTYDLESAEEEKKMYRQNRDDFDAKTAENFTKIVSTLLSVEYEIDLAYSIKSDNEKNMVLVNTKTLDTEYMYYAVPKLDLSVFMVARVTNLGELNLVPGKANIFHEGTYLGNTYINPGIMDDTLDFSLGKDPNVVVKRTLLKNDSKEKVVGDKIVATKAYKIEIRNHKNSAIKLIVQDQIPVSRNKEIEISIDELSKGQLNEVTGIVNWNTKIKASDSKDFDIKFSVKYDKTQNVNLALY